MLTDRSDTRMTALHQAAFNGNVPMMQVLLDHGAMVDLRDARGLRPLHVASYQGHFDACHLLLKWGSCVDLTATGGLSPLHLACQGGHYEIVKILLCSNADPMLRTDDGRTAFDVACEFGRFLIAQLLLSMKSVSSLLYEELDAAQSQAVGSAKSSAGRCVCQPHSCLHLAAKNGHVDVLRLLLSQPGVNPNRMSEHGTCLHLAAMHGQLEATRFLLEQGVDPSLENSFGQIAKDAISRDTPNAKELQHILSERLLAVEAIAIRDFCDLADSSSIAFRQGERLTVLEQGGGEHPNPAMWKGYVTKEGLSRSGYFPCSSVHVLPSSPLRQPLDSSPSSASAAAGVAAAAAGHTGRPPPQAMFPHPSSHGAPQPGSNGGLLGCPPVVTHSLGPLKGSVDSGLGPRQSVVSTCSSGSVGSLPDDCASLSSSSGLGGGCLPEQPTIPEHQVTFCPDEWRQAGLSASEQLLKFLNLSQFGIYYRNFEDAGYDLHAMIRCTPEDLNAVGLTNPKHRKRLRAELGRLAHAMSAAGLPDPIEEAAQAVPLQAAVGELCRRLCLPDDLSATLVCHGFGRVRDLLQMAWEDLEDIGVTKLGHQKKLMLVVDRLKRQRSQTANQSPDRRAQAAQATAEMVIGTDVIIRTHAQDSQQVSSATATAGEASQLQSPSQSHQQYWDAQLPRGGKPVAKILGRPVAVAIPEVPTMTASCGAAAASSAASASKAVRVPPPPPKRVTSVRRTCSLDRGGGCSDRESPPPLPPPLVLHSQHQFPPPPSSLPLASSGASFGQPYENLSVIENVIREMSQHTGTGGGGGSVASQAKLASTASAAAAPSGSPLSASRSDSAASVTSIPFANENCGTIRQRPLHHPNVAAHHSHSQSSPSRNIGHLSPRVTRQQPGPPIPQRQQQLLTTAAASPAANRRSAGRAIGLKAPRRDDSFSNLDDICDMLSDLQSILDKELKGQAAS